MNVTNELRKRVNREKWYPGKEQSLDEAALNYILKLEAQLREAHNQISLNMWQQDQNSRHRMGL